LANSPEEVSIAGTQKLWLGHRESSQGAQALKDPLLLFILARQGILRCQGAVRRLRSCGGQPAEKASLRIEIRLQSLAVNESLHPLAHSQQLDLRFEAEELLVQLAVVTAELRTQAYLVK